MIEERVNSVKLPQWLSKDTLTSIRARDYLKSNAESVENLESYKAFKNKVTFKIRLAKKNFYSHRKEENALALIEECCKYRIQGILLNSYHCGMENA